MQVVLLIAVWLAGFWLVTTGLLRYGPKKCSKQMVEMVYPSRHGYPDVSQPGHEMVRAFTEQECLRAPHFTHIWLRQYALFLGIAWPVVIVVAVPFTFIVWFVRSIYRAGNVKSIFPGTVE